ncbi:MAG: ABC transporter ATP-binding protein [Bacilli bacterium]|nr:ABC transporter ATP-binding protein [Bacilli bacterium]
MIEIKNITKKFQKLDENKKKVTFLADNDISFKVKEGEIVGLLGPNGAGKTTLLRIIAGIMTPNEGEVSIDGMNYKNNDLEIKKIIAFLSGNTKLYKELSPNELMEMCGNYYKVEKSVLDKRIKDIIKRFSMEKFQNQRIENLSTGQTQRVGIARCLVHNPKYYIFDEATSGLDIISSKVILDFIKEEKKNGKGVIYSTHYMEEAENICDRVVLVNKGEIIATGTPAEILKKTKTSNLRDAFFSLIGGVSNE